MNALLLFTFSGAMVVEGSMKLDSSVLQAGLSFSASGQSFIDFVSDVEFYEMPFKMCLQMKRPPVIFRLVYFH
jgi:hypothetical protein